MRILRKSPLPFLLAATLTTCLTICITAFAHAGDSADYHLESWPPESSTGLGSKTLGADEDQAILSYIHVRSAGFAGWDDSSGIYVGSQMGKLPQLYRVASPGSDRRQLTFFPKRVSAFFVNPDPHKRLLLYTQDAGGDEEFRLNLFDLAMGSNRRLDCPAGRAENVLWNDSGTAFAYAHTPKGMDRWDIRIHRIAGGAKGVKAGEDGKDGPDSLVLSKPGTWMPMDFSPDGKSLLVQKYVSASEAEILILDLATGMLTSLLPPGPPAFADNAHFVRARSGGWAIGGFLSREKAKAKASATAICFTSDRDGEFTRLYLARPMPGAGRESGPAYSIEALSPPAPWDVEWVEPSPDRSLLLYSLNEDGISRLYAVEPGASRPGRAKTDSVIHPLPGIPDGIIEGVHFRVTPGKPREFAFTVVGATFPGDAFTYLLDNGKDRGLGRGPAVRWTFSETGGLPARAFRKPQLIHFTTFDSSGAPPAPRRLPAWEYLPDTAFAHAPFPVLIQIHGGPEAQARPGFDAFVQYAAGHLGLAVILPNVRGSSGYGKSLLKADDGFLRMHSVRDIGSLVEWIRTQPDLDTNRVAVAGRSYGGFMALSALIEYGRKEGNPSGKGALSQSGNERGALIRAGISTVGITHFPTFLQKTSGYRRDLRRVEYGDERDPRMAAFLDSISPLTRLDRIRSPLLLCHGRNDPRVPYQESERIFGALKTKGVPVWFLTFEEEGHGIRDQDNQMVQYRTMAGFLAKELGLEAAGGPSGRVRAGSR